jgi:hypothetical protein
VQSIWNLQRATLSPLNDGVYDAKTLACVIGDAPKLNIDFVLEEYDGGTSKEHEHVKNLITRVHSWPLSD